MLSWFKFEGDSGLGRRIGGVKKDKRGGYGDVLTVMRDGE